MVGMVSIALALVTVGGCGGKKAADGMKPEPMPDPGVTAQTLRFLSSPVRAASVGQVTHYRAVVSQTGDTQYTLTRAPSAARVDSAGILTWTPTDQDSGPQTFEVRADNGTQTATQSFQITAARRVQQAAGAIDPGDPNGGQVTVDAPVSRVRGAAVQMDPGSLPAGQPVQVSISQVENAPVPVSARVRNVPPAELLTVDLEPNGLTFSRPVRVYLPATPMVLAMGTPEVQTYDYARGRWEKVKVVGFDAAKKLVVAEVQHFSTYVVTPSADVMALSASSGPAGSSCSEALVVRAPLTLGLAQIPAVAVNGYQGAAASVADLLTAMQTGHTLQVYTRVEARTTTGNARGWLLSSATKQADGAFKVVVTSDRSATPLLVVPAALAATDPELLAFLNGSRANVVLGGLGSLAAGATVEAEASLYLVSGVDAGRPPLEPANALGSERLDVAAVEPLVGFDDDCDGASNAYDGAPQGESAPLLSAKPASPARIVVGTPQLLTVSSSLPDTSFAWSGSDPALVVAPSADGASATVTASKTGLFHVKVVATRGTTTSATGWDIVADPPVSMASNTPPVVKISASGNVVRPDERVQLQAVAFDGEQVDLAFTWSANVPGVLAASGRGGVFAAREPGDYVITCVANDGLSDSVVATITLSVISANANRAPGTPQVVPISIVLEHEPGVPVSADLAASAKDPDGDAITFDFLADPRTPPTVTLTKDGARATVTTAVDGAYVFYVTATDSKGATSPWTPVKVLVLPTLLPTAADADKDGYPAGYDCRDDDAKIHPGAREVCGDGVDQDCSGADQAASACDQDGDRLSKDQGDCDDRDPAIFPGSRERCDGKDNDCNGTVDDGFGVAKECSVGFGACAVAGTTVCSASFSGVVCSGTPGGPTAEVCDGSDNDCDGLVDNVAGASVASDPASCGGCGVVCPASANSVAMCVQGGCVSGCAAGFVDVDRMAATGCECQVSNAGVEICDGKDNDCNGSVDEAITLPYYSGPIGTSGVGLCGPGVQACVNGKLTSVRPDRIPGVELCDKLDNDCNGKVDETFDFMRDVRNCGACGNVCPVGAFCETGRCMMMMPKPGVDGGVVVDGDAGVPQRDGSAGPVPNPGPMLNVCEGPAGSYCTDLRYDRSNCGSCGLACGSAENCVDGRCQLFDACPPNARPCPDPTTGKTVCSDPTSDPANCGGCGIRCAPMMVCDHGACIMGGGTTTCPATAPNVCKTADGKMYCSDFGSDAANCGGCGLTCPVGTACQLGKCSGGGGTANDGGVMACPSHMPNACRRPDGTVYCSDINSDVYNCGKCGAPCPQGAACTGGICQGGTTQTCPTTAPAMCKDAAGNSVCVNPSSDPSNCGACGRTCPAGVACMNGQCGGTSQTACPPNAPMTCPGTQGPYCTDPKTDPHNCGGCAKQCPAGAVCYDGRCDATGQCPADRADVCRNPDGTAYCTSFRFDPANCGACGKVCAPGAACTEGRCGSPPASTTCPPNTPVQCKDASGNPYCTDGKNDPHNCGGCGLVCAPGGVCLDGRCDASGMCPADRSELCRNPDGTAWCTNFRFDPQNCGACGKSCGPNAACNEGVCVGIGTSPCPSNLPMQCRDPKDPTGQAFCTDPQTDAYNCGGCSIVCQPGALCVSGRCEPGSTCSPDAPNLCRNPDDTGYCANFRFDAANCGGCGRLCPPGALCQEFQCTGGMTTCPVDAPAMCKDPKGNAICTNFMKDPQNCGMCGVVCQAGATCMNGSCGGGVCPTDKPNVCSVPGGGTFCTNVWGDPQNCGMCGAACAPGVGCMGGVCGGNSTTCPATAPAQCRTATGMAYCSNLQSDPGNCGACGKACASGVGCQMGQCGGGGTAVCPADLPNACTDPVNGYWRCTDVRRDSMNCGKCNAPCGPGQACTNGVCAQGAPQCEPPFNVCSTGCTILTDDPGNCGACGVKCAGVCDAGKCLPAGIQPFGATCTGNGDCVAGSVCFDDDMGWPGGACLTICDAQRPCTANQACVPAGPSTGAFGTCRAKCVADVDCGREGFVCAAGLCQPDCRKSPRVCEGGTVCTSTGACKPFEVSCMAPSTFCRDASGSGYCTDPRYDGRNCGTCGNACAAGSVCREAKCVAESSAGTPGTLVCNGPTGAPMCVNVMRDVKNCGACGTVCAIDQYCDGGKCSLPPSCPAPSISCKDPVRNHPYCTDPARDSANCGGCGKVCASNSYCEAGMCLVAMSGGTTPTPGGSTVTCPTTSRACDSPNGPYCADVYNDPKNCGACNVVCASGKCMNAKCL